MQTAGGERGGLTEKGPTEQGLELRGSGDIWGRPVPGSGIASVGCTEAAGVYGQRGGGDCVMRLCHIH